MTLSHIFLIFLVLFSLQLLTFAQNDDSFLSPGSPEISQSNVTAGANTSFTVVENTADEIGIAVSNALSLIFRIIIGSSDYIANNIAANLSQSLQQDSNISEVQATALATQVGQIVNEGIRNLNGSSQNVSNSVGNLVRDSVEAFRNARDKGEDVGAAVGVVVGNAVKNLNNTADDVGDAIEDAIDGAVDNIENLPDQVKGVADELAEAIGQAVEDLLTEASAGGDRVKFIVANAIDNAINQSEARNTSQEIGNTVSTLTLVIRSSSELIADAIATSISNAVAAQVEGVNQRDVEIIRQKIREEVDQTIQNFDISNSDISEGINFAINWDLQVRGDNTVSVSEVINIFGQIIAIGVANSLTNQRSS